jgi:uncharacterized protein (TIGR03435 family)
MKPALLMLLTALATSAQPPARPPKYEVSSLKPHAGDARFTFHIEPSGTMVATGITLRRLMMTAWNVQGFRIVGGPDWASSRSWDVQAKHDGAVFPDQVHQMLRMLLEERFRLRVRAEQRQLPVYELVVDRKGSKVPATKGAHTEPAFNTAPGALQITNVTSATFASQLSYSLARPVIGKTGLSGNFDFAFTWTPEPGEDGGPATAGLPPEIVRSRAATPDGPSIFTAIRDQLGLRLESARGPVDVIVIDDVQLPTPN